MKEHATNQSATTDGRCLKCLKESIRDSAVQALQAQTYFDVDRMSSQLLKDEQSDTNKDPKVNTKKVNLKQGEDEMKTIRTGAAMGMAIDAITATNARIKELELEKELQDCIDIGPSLTLTVDVAWSDFYNDGTRQTLKSVGVAMDVVKANTDKIIELKGKLNQECDASDVRNLIYSQNAYQKLTKQMLLLSEVGNDANHKDSSGRHLLNVVQ